MGAITGQMTNIDRDGATSMMWHAVPHAMDFDPHSGDYGLGFFGNALESGAYYVEHPTYGRLCFLCDLELGRAGPAAAADRADVHARDRARARAHPRAPAL